MYLFTSIYKIYIYTYVKALCPQVSWKRVAILQAWTGYARHTHFELGKIMRDIATTNAAIYIYTYTYVYRDYMDKWKDREGEVYIRDGVNRFNLRLESPLWRIYGHLTEMDGWRVTSNPLRARTSASLWALCTVYVYIYFSVCILMCNE